MRKAIILSFIVVVGVVLFAASGYKNKQYSEIPWQLDPAPSIVKINDQNIIVEIADTPAERAQGLSGRDPLPDNHGLLFIFPESGRHGFWMKDMKFAIDIIWIQDDTIVDIWESAPPPLGDDIPSYAPQTAANYVLEVYAGFAQQYGVKIGDQVSLDINN